MLILWLDGQDAVVAAITSAPPRSKTDISLRDWAKAGLRVPSTVRLGRLDCLEETLLIRRMGLIQTQDADEIHQIWSRHIKPAF